MSETTAVVCGMVLLACVLIVLLGLQNADSIRNCAASCGGAMASYTETKVDTGAGTVRFVPVCTCSEKK